MLYIFSGRSGAGKSTLSLAFAQRVGAVHVRVDTIEQAIRTANGSLRGTEGYAVGYALAEDQLRLGLRVIADSVNPILITRLEWRAVARRAGVPYREIEIVCSDAREHRERVESRGIVVPGLNSPSWREVQAREYAPWDQPRVVLDTAAQTPEQSFSSLLRALE